ncbi:unnamed protein product [Gongylonema pulchrum]|uniref:Protein RIC1 homolog n=1 Tax=Gongylonema pulchrum TaxID=637853 RepID=A0A3P7QJU1_9BILA|nr:unnamed protein product [Gongylonema pulchrum]
MLVSDPLLPRIVAFIQEFPNYLQTIAHCARKTELALWQALFAVTGHPRELFEKCIRDGQLETAVSFLIILQNMESSSASQEHATILLEEALSKRQWLIARDIVRFLRAIDPSDIDGSPRTPPCQKTHRNVANVVSRIPTRISTDNSDETDSFVFGSYSAPGLITRPRFSQQEMVGSGAVGRKDSSGHAASKKVQKMSSSDAPLSPGIVAGVVSTYLDDVLNRHAAHLLEDCSIRDLGLITRPRFSQQEMVGSGAVGRKDSSGHAASKKVQKMSSSDAPLSPGIVAGVVSTYLDDVLNRHAAHLLEDCSIRDLALSVSTCNTYVPDDTLIAISNPSTPIEEREGILFF